MLALLRTELFKIFKRPRTFISFGLITAVILIIELALYVDGDKFLAFASQGVTAQFDIQGNILNGYLITFIILQTLLIHVPLLIALVCGDLLAGEANMGTLRLLLSKPVSRTKLVLTKLLAGWIYVFALLVWLAIAGLVTAILLFGKGDMMVLKSTEVVIIPMADVAWRYVLAFAFASVAMCTIAALAMFLSVFGENAIGPIVTTMGIVVVLTILSTLEIPLFNTIKPYLFTTHMVGWKGFFDIPVNYGAIGFSLAVLLGYTALFVFATVWIFNRKDILS